MNEAGASILSAGPDLSARSAGPAVRSAGEGSRSRFVVRLLLISAAFQGLAALLPIFGVANEMVVAGDAAVLGTTMAAGVIGFYAWVHFAHERLPSDDTLFSVQAAHAVVCASGGYAILGPIRACALMMAAPILAFAMFARSATVQRRVVTWALAAFAVAMVAKAHLDPAGYPPRVEAMHFAGLLTICCAIVFLGTELSRLRQRSKKHRSDLEAALQRIELLATRDELTGLMSRRMRDVLAWTHQRCAAAGQPASIALLDLDHFKHVNDTHGHAVGDDVLRAFARESMASIREEDLIARWGGEEYVLPMCGTRATEALKAVDRLRERVGRSSVPAQGQALRFTFSAGVAELRAGETLAQALERADRALYAAKAGGRNRVATG